MAVVLPEIIRTQPRGITPQDIDQFAGRTARMNQQRFDAAVSAQQEQLAALGQLSYVDPVARQQAIDRQRQRYTEIADRFSGDLSRGLSSVKEAIATNAADPFYNYNRYQVEQLAAQNELKRKYGDRAIMLNDVAQQRLTGAIDPTTGQVTDPTIQNRLTANVQQASDYVAEGNKFVDDLKANVRAGALRANPKFQYMLERANVEELSEKDMLELANDPAVYEAFLRNTTALFDNRNQIGAQYDEQGNFVGNMYTMKPADPRFASGASKFLYSLLRQKKNRRTQIQTMQDPLAVYSAKLRLSKKDKEEQFARATQSKAQTDRTRKIPEVKFEELTYNEDGSLKFPKKEQAVEMSSHSYDPRATSAIDFLNSLNVWGKDRKYKKEVNRYKDNLDRITKARQEYPSLRNSTDKEVNNYLQNAYTNLAAMDMETLIPGEEAREKFGAHAASQFTQGRVSLGDQVYDLRSLKGQQELADVFGYKNFGELLSKNDLSKNFVGVATTSQAGADIGGGAFMVNIDTKNGQARQTLFVERSDEMKGIFKHLNDVYQKIGKESYVSNDVPDRYGNPTGYKFSTIYDINRLNDVNGDVTKVGFVPETLMHKGVLRFKDPTSGIVRAAAPDNKKDIKRLTEDMIAAAKTYQRENGGNLQQIIASMSDGTATYLTYGDLSRSSTEKGYVKAGVTFVDSGPNLRGTYQADKNTAVSPTQ